MISNTYSINTQFYRVKVWLSRDPIEEGDGPNLYVLLKNNAVNKWDKLGLFGPAMTGWANSLTAKHFADLRDQLQRQLRDLCPKKSTKFENKKECCEPSSCKKEADSMAKAYINALKNAYESRKVPFGGWPGNLALGGLSPNGGGRNYPDDLCIGLSCGGWQDMGHSILKPYTIKSNCWTYKTKFAPPSAFAKWWVKQPLSPVCCKDKKPPMRYFFAFYNL